MWQRNEPRAAAVAEQYRKARSCRPGSQPCRVLSGTMISSIRAAAEKRGRPPLLPADHRRTKERDSTDG